MRRIEQPSKEKGGAPQEIRQKIAGMLSRIDDPLLLERIYRFIKYIYIRKA